MMMFELRKDIFYNSKIILSLYCEPAPSFTLQAQATVPSIYLHTNGFDIHRRVSDFFKSPDLHPCNILGMHALVLNYRYIGKGGT